jgi:hypothetical protein
MATAASNSTSRQTIQAWTHCKGSLWNTRLLFQLQLCSGKDPTNIKKIPTAGVKNSSDPPAAVVSWSMFIKHKVGISQTPTNGVLKTKNSHVGGVDHHNWLVGRCATSITGRERYWAPFTRDPRKSISPVQTHTWDGCNGSAELQARVTVPYLKHDTSRKQPGQPLSSTSSHIRMIPDVRLDGAATL